MSTPAVKPGTRLAERFRLEDIVSESDGVTLWKAIDEILARPVAVHTFAHDFARVTRVVPAARSASRLTDPRLTQVFDASQEDDLSFVVSEWVTGDSLSDLLAAGPLDPERAAGLVAEAAEALAHAHEANLYHLCLRPGHLVWTTGGTLKVLGVAIDAAVSGLTTADPALDDAEGLGRLLYAGLTGHWPGDEDESGGLPAAPMSDGHFCTPRQVTAGVPSYFDIVTCRATLPESRKGQSALASPAEVAEALSGVARPMPIPDAYPQHPPATVSRSEGVETEWPKQQAPRPPMHHQPPPQRRHDGGSTLNRALMTVVVLLVIAAVGLGAWTLGRNIGKPNQGEIAAGPTSVTPTKVVEPQVVKPIGATGFDPLGDDRAEHPELGESAIDGDPATFWHTTNYNSAELGKLKEGVGLLVDLGKSTPIAKVDAVLSNY